MSRDAGRLDLASLRTLLADAERAFETEALGGILSALPDENAAVESLNAKLADLRLRLEWSPASAAWCIRADPRDASATTVASEGALFGLARLVESDGWHRIKKCQVSGCRRPFVDLTNGTIRKFCNTHRADGRDRHLE